MAETNRFTVRLEEGTARHVRHLARARGISVNEVLAELVKAGMAAEGRRQQEFVDLADAARAAADPEEARRLRGQMGEMLFGS